MPHDFQHRAHQISSSAFVAGNATVCGDVTIGRASSVWFGTVIRGDLERITIGQESNVQDLCVVHADPGYPCQIGDRVTVGHGAIVHGAVIEDDVLIGIRAVVLNGAKIGSGSIVGSGSLVTEGFEVPPDSVVMGVPGRIVRKVGTADRIRSQRAWQNYVEAARQLSSRI